MRYMNRFIAAAIVAALALNAGSGSVSAQSGHDLFQKALTAERADGNLKQAIQLYEQIVKQFEKSDRALAAKALVQLGQCYEKLGSAEAKKSYERVARDYADQKEPAKMAGDRLAALRDADSTSAPPVGPVLTGNQLSEFGASITADGRLLAYVTPGMDAPTIRDMASGRITQLGAKAGAGVGVDYLFVSPDQQEIAYSWVRNNDQELRILSLASRASPRVLLRSDSEVMWFNPKGWSPDKTWILVEVRRRDGTWQFARVSTLDGKLQTLETTGWRRNLGYGRMRVSLSPDGRYLAYAALAENPRKPALSIGDPDDTYIYLLATDGSSKTELTRAAGHNEDPVWAPDGSHVLFFSDRAGTFDLWAVEVRAGKPVGNAFPLKRNIGSLFNTIPIGMTRAGVYYYTNYPPSLPQLAIAELPSGKQAVRSGSATVIEGGIGYTATWSPDGKRLAFVTPRRDVVVRSVATAAETRYSRVPTGQISGRPLWFHASNALLLTVDHPSEPEGHMRALFRLDLETGEFSELTTVGRFAWRGGFFAALSPDDRTLYARGEIVTDPPANTLSKLDRIVAVDLRTGEQKVILTTPEGGTVNDVTLSPDGATLAFYHGNPAKGDSTVAVAAVDGSSMRDLPSRAPLRDTMFKISWTQDSKALLIAHSDESDAWKILKLPIDGGPAEPLALASTGRLGSFDLSKSGSQLVFSTATGAGVQLWALDTTRSLKGRRAVKP